MKRPSPEPELEASESSACDVEVLISGPSSQADLPEFEENGTLTPPKSIKEFIMKSIELKVPEEANPVKFIKQKVETLIERLSSTFSSDITDNELSSEGSEESEEAEEMETDEQSREASQEQAIEGTTNEKVVNESPAATKEFAIEEAASKRPESEETTASMELAVAAHEEPKPAEASMNGDLADATLEQVIEPNEATTQAVESTAVKEQVDESDSQAIQAAQVIAELADSDALLQTETRKEKAEVSTSSTGNSNSLIASVESENDTNKQLPASQTMIVSNSPKQVHTGLSHSPSLLNFLYFSKLNDFTIPDHLRGALMPPFNQITSEMKPSSYRPVLHSYGVNMFKTGKTEEFNSFVATLLAAGFHCAPMLPPRIQSAPILQQSSQLDLQINLPRILSNYRFRSNLKTLLGPILLSTIKEEQYDVNFAWNVNIKPSERILLIVRQHNSGTFEPRLLLDPSIDLFVNGIDASAHHIHYSDDSFCFTDITAICQSQANFLRIISIRNSTIIANLVVEIVSGVPCPTIAKDCEFTGTLGCNISRFSWIYYGEDFDDHSSRALEWSSTCPALTTDHSAHYFDKCTFATIKACFNCASTKNLKMLKGSEKFFCPLGDGFYREDFIEFLNVRACELLRNYRVDEFNAFFASLNSTGYFCYLMPSLPPLSDSAAALAASRRLPQNANPPAYYSTPINHTVPHRHYFGPFHLNAIDSERFALELTFEVLELPYGLIFLDFSRLENFRTSEQNTLEYARLSVFVNNHDVSNCFIINRVIPYLAINAYCRLGSNVVRLIHFGPPAQIKNVCLNIHSWVPAGVCAKTIEKFGSKLPEETRQPSNGLVMTPPAYFTDFRDEFIDSYFHSAKLVKMVGLRSKPGEPFNKLKSSMKRIDYITLLSNHALKLKKEGKFAELAAYFDFLNGTGYFAKLMPRLMVKSSAPLLELANQVKTRFNRPNSLRAFDYNQAGRKCAAQAKPVGSLLGPLFMMALQSQFFTVPVEFTISADALIGKSALLYCYLCRSEMDYRDLLLRPVITAEPIVTSPALAFNLNGQVLSQEFFHADGSFYDVSSLCLADRSNVLNIACLMEHACIGTVVVEIVLHEHTGLPPQRQPLPAPLLTPQISPPVSQDTHGYVCLEYLPVGLSKADAVAKFKPSKSDDIAFVDDSITVDTRCPISLGRLKRPVRFVDCKHLQCFDYDVFRQFSLSGIRRGVYCPVCSVKAAMTSGLVECGLFAEILLNSGEADRVKVDLNTGNVIQNAEKSKRDDYCQEPSVKADPLIKSAPIIDLCDSDEENSPARSNQRKRSYFIDIS